MPISICSLLLLGAMVAAPQGTGNASGKFTVDDKTTELRYVRAREGKAEFDSTKREIRVVLSDVPITDDDMDDDFSLGAGAREGKLHAVEVRLNPVGEPTDGSLYHEAFGSGHLSVSGMHHFEHTAWDDKTVAGKLYMEEPGEFMDKKYVYTATFSTELEHEPKPTAEGAAAAASGPGKAVLAYYNALRAHDLAAVKSLSTAERLKPLDTPDGMKMFDMAVEFVRSQKGFKVVRVYENGDHAKVEAEDKDPDGKSSGTTTFKTVRVNGEWKLTE
jgi:hypothetical protein